MTFVSLFGTETMSCCTGEDGTTELWVLEHLLVVLLPTVPLMITVLQVVIIV